MRDVCSKRNASVVKVTENGKVCFDGEKLRRFRTKKLTSGLEI